MKTKLKPIVLMLATFVLASQQAYCSDSIKYAQLEQELRSEIAARKTLQREVSNQKVLALKQAKLIDSLQVAVSLNTKNIKTTADQLGVKIDETNVNLNAKANESDFRSRTIWGVVLFSVLAIVFIIVYYLLHRRINKGTADIVALREESERINEEILNKMSSEMEELQKISSKMNVISESTGKNEESDHSLIKTLADRITFMEMTLYKMDPKVRGYRQLTKSIAQMKDNLMANGYEIVDMLGKPYDGGMKVIANFVEDEELEEGKQIITGIIKPQINYKGVMIQAAQITVSQN